MFLLKSLGNVIFGRGEGELVQLPSGKFYYHSSTAEKQQVYAEASIAVKKTSTPFQYELVISSKMSEDDEDMEDAEASFLIDRCLVFKAEGHSLTWLDIEDDAGKAKWEFVVDSSSTAVSIDLFEETVVGCMFERFHQKSHESASTGELTKFIDELNEIHPQEKITPINQGNTAKATSVPEKNFKLPDVELPIGTVVLSVHCRLCLFDVTQEAFVTYLPSIQAEMLQLKKFSYSLVLLSQGVPVVCQPIENRMNPHFDHANYSIIWVWFDPATALPAFSMSLKFEEDTKSDFVAMVDLLKQTLYETTHKSDYKQQKAFDMDYMLEALDNMEMDIDDDYAEEEEEEEEAVEETPKKASRPIYVDSDSDEETKVLDQKSKNSLLAVGYKHDRSFVVRGNKIGVFKHTEDDELEFATTIKSLQLM
jgi:hypothetical protein